ncbi:hypothetical protein [Clostridium niameyense]|uniref:hypothetical protein n=1 Tax=Clostridium niameyense TaxID=1622073 RepID=UPI00067EE9F9|nr:hypothetical protein [Clostridium niameyense]
MDLLKSINEAKEYIKNVNNENIDIAIILGSALGDIVDDIQNKKIISYINIPNFSVSTIKEITSNI